MRCVYAAPIILHTYEDGRQCYMTKIELLNRQGAWTGAQCANIPVDPTTGIPLKSVATVIVDSEDHSALLNDSEILRLES